MYFLGIDVGSSSVKTSIFDAEKGLSVGKATFPASEQRIDAEHPGWAEQDPELWWKNFKAGYEQIVAQGAIDTRLIAGIGISYQMHGLVALDKEGHVLRKSIIWCDSRAVDLGEAAYQKLGASYCHEHLLNSPGNFTGAKLKWVKENEPGVFADIHSFMLPGDYIAYRLSGVMSTTQSGLSEGVLWDFTKRKASTEVLAAFGFEASLIPQIVPSIGFQCTVSATTAKTLGLRTNVPITYRAGDQPNNAFSLGVIDAGQVATTAGTSGVIYAVSDQNFTDPQSRINTFLHVNDSPSNKRNGVLICVNGAGSLYSWLKRLFEGGVSYDQMNEWAAQTHPGSDGLQCFPFGNGAERILGNRLIQANLLGLDFNRHQSRHLIRASMEGIVFALQMGFDILQKGGFACESVRSGNSNLFLSDTFRTIFAHVTGKPLQIFETDGAEGAARGAALGAGFFNNPNEAFQSLKLLQSVEPSPFLVDQYQDLFGHWKNRLDILLASAN